MEVRGLRKCFGSQEVLRSVNLAIPRGAIVTVLGKSGTGKSVLLKCLAGILRPDRGEILFDGKPMRSDQAVARREFRRRTSYLFQSNALFDSLNAYENVALPLEQTREMGRAEVRKRTFQALHQLELDDFAQRYPSQMSGGMQKRLALARAIVTNPELVLFDEPTAGLDPIRRNAVFEMIVHLQRNVGFTAVVVTHDIHEALVASDSVAFLDGGELLFQGSPDEFEQSTNISVVKFRDNIDSLRKAIEEIRQGSMKRDNSLEKGDF